MILQQARQGGLDVGNTEVQVRQVYQNVKVNDYELCQHVLQYIDQALVN